MRLIPLAMAIFLPFIGYMAAMSDSSLVGIPTIHDGDTITLQGQRIRLFGIDAEELSEPNGARAKQGLASIIFADRLPIRCEDRGGRTWGRIVAECFTAHGVSINAGMVRRGFALDCARYSRGKYRAMEPGGVRSRLRQKPYC